MKSRCNKPRIGGCVVFIESAIERPWAQALTGVEEEGVSEIVDYCELVQLGRFAYCVASVSGLEIQVNVGV